MKMRTIDGCISELQQKDPNTAVTKTWLRRMVVCGEIPSVKCGKKYLVDLDMLDSYIEAKMTGRSA